MLLGFSHVAAVRRDWEQARQQFAILHGGPQHGMVHLPEGQSGKEQSTAAEGVEVWDEQRKSANQYMGPQRSGVRNEEFLASSFFDLFVLHQNGAGEGDGGEFGSSRGGEENRGRESAARGGRSTTRKRDLGRHVEKGFRGWEERCLVRNPKQIETSRGRTQNRQGGGASTTSVRKT